jgi:hypothetical protein
MSQKRRAHGGCRITEWELRGSFAEAPSPWVTSSGQFTGVDCRRPYRGAGDHSIHQRSDVDALGHPDFLRQMVFGMGGLGGRDKPFILGLPLCLKHHI